MEYESNWAWGLPLIALNVVIHVFGVGIFTEKVEHILTRLKSRRRFTSIFAMVMSVTVTLATGVSSEWGDHAALANHSFWLARG